MPSDFFKPLGEVNTRLGSVARPKANDAAPVEEEAPPLLAPGPEKPKPKTAKLSNPKWEADKVGFNEETPISVELDLPAEISHKKRVTFELFAKTPKGPEKITNGEAMAEDGKATLKIPVYIPNFQDEDGNRLQRVEYYFVARHSEAEPLDGSKAPQVVDEMADRVLEMHILQNLTFATGKSFIRASEAGDLKALGQAVKEWKGKHSDCKLAVFGHADAVGEESSNKQLSERRAKSVQAYLAKDAKPWEDLYGAEKWGLAAVQELLKHLGHDPGVIDGQDGPKTQSAVKDFQNKKGLAATGTTDAKTREALFIAYFESNGAPGCGENDFDAIDGKAYTGCSEFNLIEKTPGACEANRRVAVLLLKVSKNFPIHYPCKHGAIMPCQKQAGLKGERRTPGFKCRFYDNLVVERKGAGPKAGKLKWANVNEGEELKQYVNLKADKPGRGPERTLEIEVEGASDGTKVSWKVTAGKDNSKRNDPKAGLKPDANGKLVEFKSGVAELETEVKGGKTTLVLACGLAGGDSFKVEAGLEKGKADGTVTVVNWRRLYYQLTAPKGLKPSIDKLNDAMQGIHVECEKSEEVEVPLEDGPAGSWVNGEDLGRGTGRKLAVGSHNRAYFHNLFKAAEKPIEAHYMFCHFQLDGASTPKALDLDGDNSSRITLPGEKSEVMGLSFSANEGFPKFLIFPTALQTGSPSVRCSWSSKSASGPHTGKMGLVPEDHIVVNYRDYADEGGRVFAKFPAEAVAVVRDGETITLSFSVQLARGWYNGESDGHLLLIAAQRTKKDGTTIDWEGINGTMGHELGHAMKMVAMSNLIIPGIADVRKEHTRWYDTKRGHQGDHCANGVPQEAYDNPLEMMSDYEGTCVMFGAGVEKRSHKFCEHCTPLLQGADLSALSK